MVPDVTVSTSAWLQQVSPRVCEGLPGGRPSQIGDSTVYRKLSGTSCNRMCSYRAALMARHTWWTSMMSLWDPRESLIISPLDPVPAQCLQGDRHSFLGQTQVAVDDPAQGRESPSHAPKASLERKRSLSRRITGTGMGNWIDRVGSSRGREPNPFESPLLSLVSMCWRDRA